VAAAAAALLLVQRLLSLFHAAVAVVSAFAVYATAIAADALAFFLWPEGSKDQSCN